MAPFLLFPLLPVEIRREIWKYCLPRRVVEIDVPTRFPADADIDNPEQICSYRTTTVRNTSIPVIFWVCHESRRVVVENGLRVEFKNYGDHYTRLRFIWLQPLLDVLHLNSTDVNFLQLQSMEDYVPSAFKTFLDTAAEHDTPVSFMANLLTAFNRVLVTDEYYDYGVEDIRNRDIMLVSRPLERCLVTVQRIVVHVDDEVAVRSGLFGSLGEAPVQLVDFDDVERIRAYRDLCVDNAAKKNPWMNDWFSDVVCSHLFPRHIAHWKYMTWTRLLFSLWMREVADWLDDRDAPCGIDSPLEAWDPPLEDSREDWRNVPHGPNWGHPWIMTTMAKIPILQPQIMFRHCPNRCYEKNLHSTQTV